ncbi:TPA: hypothetical protein KKX27_002585 [Legionella pneumophila]|nr:hypothetical protein [Legionella pneumophila]HEN8241092.1 hypothetical protein [Legionella pneumophila]
MNEQETLLSHAHIEELINEKSGISLVKKMSSKSLVASSYFAENCDRYYFDFSLDYKQGWEQYDTQSDAWYFGIWVNIKTMQVLEYCEGDVILRTYYHKYDLKEALDKMADYHGEPPPAFTSINENGDVCHFYDERPSIT